MSFSDPIFIVKDVTLCAVRPIEDKGVRVKGILSILKEANEKSDFDEEEINQHK